MPPEDRLRYGEGIHTIPVGTTGIGWIIAGGTVHNNGSAEWHNIYSDMPALKKVTLSVGKTVNGKTPADNEKFEFELQHGEWIVSFS